MRHRSSVVLSSTSTAIPAFEVGDWPFGLEIIIDHHGARVGEGAATAARAAAADHGSLTAALCIEWTSGRDSVPHPQGREDEEVHRRGAGHGVVVAAVAVAAREARTREAKNSGYVAAAAAAAAVVARRRAHGKRRHGNAS